MNTSIIKIDPYRSYLQYLSISRETDTLFGKLSWSLDGEALESNNGKVFAFRTQIAHFIDGFVSIHSLLSFEQIIILLNLFIGTESSSPGVIRLRELFKELGQPLFNAGVLAAILTKELPRSSINLDGRLLARWLTENNSRTLLSLHHLNHSIQPETSVLQAREFEQQLYTQLSKRSVAELHYYLRYGAAPLPSETINKTAEILYNRPRGLIEKFRHVAQQSLRIAPSVGLIPVLESALHLPSRRLKPQSLQLGGYSYVSKRGTPDRLLLSQFALDDDEFVRRFAEGELLYFQREGSYQTQALRLIILIDQGVRTWGTVRLALTAAVQVFAQWSQRRGLTFLVGTTSQLHQLFNPLEMTEADLTHLLEASDFNTSNEEILRLTLARREVHDAEMILLTHPISLNDRLLTTTTLANLPKSSRFFAVTADESGLVVLNRWSGKGWEQTNRCRVDYSTTFNTSRIETKLQASPHVWTGDVSPFPMPFVFGPVNCVRRFVFNLSEETILCVTSTGQALLLHLDERQHEVLPDPNFKLVDHEPFIDVVATECGFAALMRADDHRTHLVVYDLENRHIRVMHDFCASAICYLQHLNTVVSRSLPPQAIDLTTFGRWPCTDNDKSTLTSRARSACSVPQDRLPPSQTVRVLNSPASFVDYHDEPAIVIDPITSMIWILGAVDDWPSLDPQSLEPLISQNTKIDTGELTRDVAAVGFETFNRHYILVFNRENPRDTTVLARSVSSAWTLAPSGRMIVYVKRRSGDVCVRDLQSAEDLLIQPPRLLKNQLQLRGNDFGIELVHGRYQHLLDWSSGMLRLSVRSGVSSFLPVMGFVEAINISQNPDLNLPQYRSWNRVIGVLNCGRLMMVVDSYNQVYVYQVVPEQSLVAVFLVKREYLCGWLPDGTRFGDSIVSGYPPSSQSMRRFGYALCNSSFNDG